MRKLAAALGLASAITLILVALQTTSRPPGTPASSRPANPDQVDRAVLTEHAPPPRVGVAQEAVRPERIAPIDKPTPPPTDKPPENERNRSVAIGRRLTLEDGADSGHTVLLSLIEQASTDQEFIDANFRTDRSAAQVAADMRLNPDRIKLSAIESDRLATLLGEQDHAQADAARFAYVAQMQSALDVLAKGRCIIYENPPSQGRRAMVAKWCNEQGLDPSSPMMTTQFPGFDRRTGRIAIILPSHHPHAFAAKQAQRELNTAQDQRLLSFFRDLYTLRGKSYSGGD